MQRLTSRYQALRQRTVAKQRPAPFNIFTLLGVEKDEVRTHSRLLADWLNPSGTHRHGALFLGQFLKLCGQKQRTFQLPTYPVYDSQWRVQTERYVGKGFLDIVIESPQLGYLVVIENKIQAAEQPEQLTRYARWMQTRIDQFPHQLLLFLTPDGRPSATNSATPYVCLSYAADIDRWLGATLPRLKSLHVKSIVSQYRSILPLL